MILSKFDNIAIKGIAAAVSNQWGDLDSYREEVGNETIDKFKKMVGIEGRYDAEFFQTTSDFCFVAAREILEKKNVNKEDIGLLIFVTQTPDYGIPATACVLHKRLGLQKDCLCFDVNLGCSGYVYGLNIAASIMATSNVKKALLLVGDTSAKERKANVKIKTSNSARLLFGDSGTATLLEKEDGNQLTAMMRSDGEGYKAIIAPYGQWRHPYKTGVGSVMDDIAVFNFTISDVPKMLKEFMEETGTTPDDYDGLVPHQANKYILKQLAKKAKWPFEKVMISLDEFGNTSSSSIPITLVKCYGDKNEGEIKPLMCGFGIGLSWGTVAAKIDSADILPLIKTSEYFDDGYEDDIPEELKEKYMK